MTIVHPIKDRYKFNLLLTCPRCLGSLIKTEQITDNKKLLTYDETKKLIGDGFSEGGNEEYEVWCPNCNGFNIIYTNEMPKIKQATQTGRRLIDNIRTVR